MEFSMIAGQSRVLGNHVIKGKGRNDVDVLKTGVLYGANASGKSNFIKAVKFAKDIITNGLSQVDTLNKYFRLEAGRETKPSQFEFEFKTEGKQYAYGFSVLLNTKTVVEEWLYEIGKTVETKIFERKIDEKGMGTIAIGIKFKSKDHQNRIKYIGEDTTKGQLFLTEANRRNIQNIPRIEPLLQTFQWIEKQLIIIFPNSKFGTLNLLDSNHELSKAFHEFLGSFDMGITGVATKAVDFDQMFGNFPDVFKNQLTKNIDQVNEVLFNLSQERFTLQKDKEGKLTIHQLMTKHRMKNSDEEVFFDIEEESDGTQRMFDLIPILISLATTSCTFLVDELERSLHTVLTRNIIRQFIKDTEGLNSQLIVTTHESSLLDFKLLRKDEIWFVEKNKHGESKIYSLEEFKPRYDKEIRKSYLLGRFGAIPTIQNLQKSDWL